MIEFGVHCTQPVEGITEGAGAGSVVQGQFQGFSARTPEPGRR